jgi:hypothetical protein
MPVKFYEFGRLVGGSSVVPSESDYGPPQVFTGTLVAGDTTITFDHSTKSIQVINTHDTSSFSFSLDGGATWINLAAYGQFKDLVSLASIILRSTAGGETYTVVAVLTE